MNRLLAYRWSDLPILTGWALVYAASIYLVLGYLITDVGTISIMWIPGGIGLAMLLLGGNQYWPTLFTGSLLARALLGYSTMPSICVALSNTVEPLLAVWMLNQGLPRMGLMQKPFDPQLLYPIDYLWLAFAGVSAAMVAALIGVASFWQAGILDMQLIPQSLQHWWMGNSLGIILVTPMILVWRQAPKGWFKHRGVLETTACFGLLFLAGQIIFLDWLHAALGFVAQGFFIFIFVIWAAVRFNRHGVLLVIAITALQALSGALQGTGYFAHDIAQSGLTNLWLYIMVLSAVGIMLALIINERNRVEEELRSLSVAIEQSPTSVVITDLNGIIEYVNPQFTVVTGYSSDEAIGQDPRILNSGLTPKKTIVELWSTLKQNKPWQGQLINRRKNGEIYWEEAYISPVKNAASQTSHYVAVKLDITHRHLTEQHERSQSQVLKMLAQDAPLSQILQAIALAVEQDMSSSLCSIQLLDKEGKHLRTLVAPSLPDFYTAGTANIEIGIGAGSCGTAAFTGERVIADRIQTHPYWITYKDLAAQANLGACWSEPIKNAAGKVLGTLAIYHPDPYRPSENDIHQMEQTANLIGIALEKQHASEALQESSQHLRTLIETTPDCVKLVDSQGILLSMNGAGLKLIEADNEQSLLGRNIYPLIAPEYRESFRLFNEQVCRGQKGTLEFEIIGLRGTRRWVESHATPFPTKPEGGLVQLALTRDITEKKKSAAQIWRQANIDPLTGLPNRHMFHERLKQEINKAHRDGLTLALLFLDLDHFKEINDTLGHDMGDLLLKEAARRLTHCVRETDSISRLGGDEFTIILSELHDPSNIERIAQNILNKLSEPFQLQDDVAYISVSIGVALYPDDAKDTQVLLKCSDQAMYLAKNTGRNRYGYFTKSMQEAAHTRMRIATDLRSALADDQFRLVYQPIVELATGQIHKAEALLRWHHPTLGLVSPADFITIAEETGVIVSIGDWAFRNAVKQVLHWRTKHHAEFQISINKSPVQFHNPNNPHQSWFDHLQLLGLPGQSVVIEITEGLLLDANISTSDQLLKFRDAGIQVALDDFGTGYSSLAYIKKFDIDYIKIDQTFVRNLETDTDDLVLCEAIIVMAHKLGIKVIAEGVETALQRDLLIAAGCDYGQGYLFSRPIPPDQFDALLSARQNGCLPLGELIDRASENLVT